MKQLFFTALLITGFAFAAIGQAKAGPCDYSSGIASDGSRCGGRSAESRPGGYDPYNPYGR